MELSSKEDAVILDTRDRLAFMNGHLKGSLLSPMDKQFNTTAGSFIREEEEIYLIIDQANLEEAVRDLIRIGLDNIKGYATPAELHAFAQEGGELQAIEVIDFEQTRQMVSDSKNHVLDVRKASEFSEGHIEGATNIAHTRLLEREDELPKDKTLLVHCKSGYRASVSAALLHRDGYEVKYIDDNVERALD